MAQLQFLHGLMGCGKSTLALSTHHNLARTGRVGRLFTRHDRAGEVISSRLGLEQPATVVGDSFDFCSLAGEGLSYLIADEAQFFSPEQIEQLAVLVDEHDVDVYAYGLTTDFRSRLFPGAQRLMELADSQLELQLKVWCWCGQPAKVSARLVGGDVAYEGPQVVIGDTQGASLTYTVLCRRHWRSGETG